MSYILNELQPSSLLWKEEMCQAAKDLKENCKRFRETDDPRQLEIWAEEAKRLLLPDKRSDYAIISIYLADRYHELDIPYPALRLSEEAGKHFCPWPERRHQHNCAVAFYAIGLAHDHLGNQLDALGCYTDALEEFQKAKKLWQHEHVDDMIEQCDIAIRWIERYREQLEHARSSGRVPNQVRLPVLSCIAAGESMLASENFDEWICIDKRRANKANFALRVKGDSMIDAGIHDGDRVLIEQREDWPTGRDQIVAVIIERVDSEATLKKTYQAKDHHIRLEPANEDYPFIIIKPDSLPESTIYDRYAKTHPKRHLKIYSGVEVRISGWFKGKV